VTRTDTVERLELIRGVNFHVQSSSLGILVPVHHLDDFRTKDQLCLGRTEVVLVRRDL
jgi:hypothetical protein